VNLSLFSAGSRQVLKLGECTALMLFCRYVPDSSCFFAKGGQWEQKTSISERG